MKSLAGLRLALAAGLLLVACGEQQDRAAQPAAETPKQPRAAARTPAAPKAPARTEPASEAKSAAEPAAEGGPTVVVLYTTKGEIEIELDAARAPITVENFLAYVDAGHYDGTIFHRVIPGFMIQGGGFTPQFQQKPTQEPIRNEADNGLKNERGSLAMARTGDPNSATAQFFINLKDNTFLDHGVRDFGYAVFGRVGSGMEVVDEIATVETATRSGHQNVPVEAVVINRAARKPATDD